MNYLTVRELIEKLKEFNGDLLVCYNGDPIVDADTDTFMVPHRYDEGGDEVTVVELEIYCSRRSGRSYE